MANQMRVNPIGQIADGVMEQLKSTGSQAAQQLANEPAKILEQILGGAQDTPAPTGETQIEQGGGQVSSQAAQQASSEQLIKKQQEERKTAEALYKLHQQRLQEEVAYHAQHKQEEKQEEMIEEQEEDRKKIEIVQLKRQKDDEVWKDQIKAVQGSHEGQQGKM